MYLGVEFSPEAESAAFAQVHRLAVAIGQLRDQGNWDGVKSLLPYFRSAIDKYKAIGQADPSNLSSLEQSYLNAVQSLQDVGLAAKGQVQDLLGSATLPILGVAAILFFVTSPGRRSLW